MTDSASTLHQLILYGRPGCCLCDEARQVVERVRSQVEFILSEQNIEEDEELLRRYLERIPVLTVDGVEAFELFVEEAALLAALGLSAERPGAGRVGSG